MAHEVFLVGSRLGAGEVSELVARRAEELIEQMRHLPLPLLWGCLGLVPAISEELLFRGFLWSALRRRFGPVPTWLLTSLVFSLMHVLSPAMLTPERFLPSLLLGLVLGWIAWQSGSVLPGILLHAVHNTLLVTVSYHPQWLQAIGIPDEPHRQHLPGWLLAASAVVSLLGVTLLAWQRRRGSGGPR